MYLCKPDKTIIGSIYENEACHFKPKFGKINELEFDVPVLIERNHELITNPLIELLRLDYLIKFIYNDYIEYFIITKPQSQATDDRDLKHIECYSLPYEMDRQKIYDLELTSKNLQETVEYVLKALYGVSDAINALWTIDYINPIFLNTYRSFNVTDKSLIEFILNDISETFNCVPVFDTLTRKISFYSPDDFSTNKGLTFDYGKYLKTLEIEPETTEFCTILKPFGEDGLTISGVNPTGQNYLQDYSYYLYPYEEDELGNIVNHSYYMSDSLCGALLDYNTLLETATGVLDIAEIGTNTTNIKLTSHGLVTGDWILNRSRNNAYRVVTNVVDQDNITVAEISGQTPDDIIYKYKTGTYLKLIFDLELLNSELTTLKNDLNTLNNEKTEILDIIAVQQEVGTYTTYDYTYSGTTVTSRTVLSENNKYLVMCKVSNITDLIVKLDTVTKTLVANTWVVLGKLGSVTTSSVEVSGSATNVGIKIIVIRITDEEYTTVDNESILINKYCLDKKEAEILVYTNETVGSEGSIILKNYEITAKETEITVLTTSLSIASNFTDAQQKELWQFQKVEKWEDTNYINAIDLYFGAIDKFASINSPQDVINIDIVNFLECIEEQINWDKLNIGDIANIKYDVFGTNSTARMIEFDFNFDDQNVSLTLANIYKVKSKKDKLLNELYKSIYTTKEYKKNKIGLDELTVNFNANNDGISDIPADVTLPASPITYIINTDSSANINFSWSFVGATDEYNIDGFEIRVRKINYNEPYTFGSTIAKEELYYVHSHQRSFELSGVPADLWYTFGIRAYRKVRADINSDGVLYSENIVSSGNPIQPSAMINFTGLLAGNTIQYVLSSITTAQETADGQIQGFFQDTQPSIFNGVSGDAYFGDIWIDTDGHIPPSTADIYRCQDNSGGSQGTLGWVSTPTNAIGIIYRNAYLAQQTANTKVVTFYQGSSTDGIPTSVSIGDFWVDTDNNNHIYRASIIGANEIKIGEWESVRDTSLDETATNFNNRNDRKSAVPASPVIANDGSAIDHTINTDGSVNISFEWTFTGTGDAYDIDGFIVYLRTSSSSSSYTFGTNITEEQVYYLTNDRRSLILYGVPSDKYYTFGVLAYRNVDNDIYSTGIVKSGIIQSTFIGTSPDYLDKENPYLPNTTVAFNGDITGTVKDKFGNTIASENGLALQDIAGVGIESGGIITTSTVTRVIDASTLFISYSSGTIEVNNTTGFPSSGTAYFTHNFFHVGSEVYDSASFTYTSKDATHLYGVSIALEDVFNYIKPNAHIFTWPVATVDISVSSSIAYNDTFVKFSVDAKTFTATNISSTSGDFDGWEYRYIYIDTNGVYQIGTCGTMGGTVYPDNPPAGCIKVGYLIVGYGGEEPDGMLSTNKNYDSYGLPIYRAIIKHDIRYREERLLRTENGYLATNVVEYGTEIQSLTVNAGEYSTVYITLGSGKKMCDLSITNNTTTTGVDNLTQGAKFTIGRKPAGGAEYGIKIVWGIYVDSNGLAYHVDQQRNNGIFNYMIPPNALNTSNVYIYDMDLMPSVADASKIDLKIIYYNSGVSNENINLRFNWCAW